MHTLHITSTTTVDGVVQREFTVGDLTGALWSAADAAGPAPLVLLGHGGGTHRTAPAMVGRARRLVVDGGLVAASLDAPGHGGRPRTAYDERETDAMQEAMEAGEPVGPIVVRYNGVIAEQAVPEWRTVLDALLQLPDVDGPVGYYGINMGTAIGVPLIVAEPRIRAAVLGQFWPDTLVPLARRITVPIEFDLQWDDQHIDRNAGLELFDAFASTEKTLHANAGRHKELPRFEADSAVRFFVRHLRAGSL